MLVAAYPAGALVGAIPSGIVAARLGVKPTVLVGLTLRRGRARSVRPRRPGVAARRSPASPGPRELVHVDGRALLARPGSPAGQRGALIGRAFAAAVVGALFGPVLGAVASFAGIGWTFGAIASRLDRSRRLGGGDRRRSAPSEPRRSACSARARATAGCSAPRGSSSSPRSCSERCRCWRRCGSPHLGLGALGIGAVFLSAAALEAVNNVVVGRITDRDGPLRPVLAALVSSTVIAAVLPWPDDRFVLAALSSAPGSRSARSSRRG